MDVMINLTQIWLNQTYSGRQGYIMLNLDDSDVKGKTGWTTIYALTRALQIELGITETADNFGPSTQSRFSKRFPNGIIQQKDGELNADNIYGIIQGCLWCKGYATGADTITTHFYGGTGSAVKSLKSDMGINSSSSTITLNVMKALLSMDQYVLLADYGGKSEIRDIQRTLNADYQAYVGIVPCDGIYGRAMNLGLIKVLQAIEGYSVADATGNFGNGTKSRLPILPDVSNPKAITLFRYCLTCNGYPAGTSSVWDSSLVSLVRSFQTEYFIPVTGKGDVDTWMSLLLSKGNEDRAASGCDCSTILDHSKAQALYNAGYRYVGRYLTGTAGYDEHPKNMTRTELEAIFSAGLRVFAIFQEGVADISHYTYENGFTDASKAVYAASTLGIPTGTILYFAIDYDLMDGEISTTAQQYFRGVRDFLLVSYLKYKAGVYGSRNVCSKICAGGLAESSFVSDMSTGFSGNMGYRIPANWAFDQFSEYEFYYAEGSFGLDKDAVSGKYEGFDHIISSAETVVPAPTMEDYENAALEILRTAKLIPVPQIGIEFNKEFTIDLGPVTVTFSASTSDTFFVNDEPATWQDITVANDSFSVDIMNLSTNLFGKLDATLKANCGLTGPTISFDLATAVGNGVVHYGMKLRTDGNLDVYYKCEKILWTSADGSTEYKVYVQMKYTFQSTVSPGGDEPDVTYDYEPVTNESPDISVAMALILVAAIVIADAASGGTLTELIPLIISTAKLAH